MAFALMPKIIQSAGTAEFGLWTLVFSIIGLFEWLDLGFAAAIVKYVAQCDAQGDPARRNQILSTIGASYSVLAILGTAGLAGVGLLFDRLFTIPQDLYTEALWLLGILSVRSILMGLPCALFRGILFGEQHMALLNMTTAVFNLAYGAAGWFSLHLGHGVVALAAINLVFFLLESAVYALLCYRTVPDLELSPRLIDLKIIVEISSLNLTQIVANTAAMLVQKAGPIIVQVGIGLTAVSLYTIPSKIVSYLYMVLKQFTNSLSPTIVHLESSGDRARLKVLIISSIKIATGVATAVAIASGVSGDPLITLWVGEGFRDSVPVLTILLVSMWTSAPEIVASEVLVMTGHHVQLVQYFLLQCVSNILISALLVKPLGMTGVALGTLLSGLIGGALVIRRMCAIYGMSVPHCLRESILPLVLPALGQLTVTFITITLRPPASLIMVMVENVPGLVAFSILFWSFATTTQERSILERICHRVGLRWTKKPALAPARGQDPGIGAGPAGASKY